MSQVVTNTCPPDPAVEAELEVPDEALPPTEMQQAAYDRLRAWARRMSESELIPFRADLRLAAANAREGHDAFAPHLPRARNVGEVDLNLVENFGPLAAAALFSQRRVELTDAPQKTLATRLSRGRKLRFTLLHQAWAAASVGLIPEGPVERIAKGTGAIDAAEDLVALTALYKEHHSALCTRTVVTDALLAEAEHLGNELQNELKPMALPVRKSTEIDPKREAIDDRNRFWTLLVQAHKETKRVADFLGVGNTIPSLQSRKPLKKKAPVAKPPTQQE